MAHVIMDNFQLNICSRSVEHFRAGMKMVFDTTSTAKYYCINKERSEMVLFWWKSEQNDEIILRDDNHAEIETLKIQDLPYEMSCNQATDFAWNWLKGASYVGNDHYHDVSRVKGFRLWTSPFNQVYGHNGSIIAIRTEYALIGK